MNEADGEVIKHVRDPSEPNKVNDPALAYTLAEMVAHIETLDQLDPVVDGNPNNDQPLEVQEDNEKVSHLTLFAALGVLAISSVVMARGGNYKVIRQNLSAQGKMNKKKPMSPEQKKLRRRKRKKK